MATLRRGHQGTDLSQRFNPAEVGTLVWFLPARAAQRFPGRTSPTGRRKNCHRPRRLCDRRSSAISAFVRTAQEIATTAAATLVTHPGPRIR